MTGGVGLGRAGGGGGVRATTGVAGFNTGFGGGGGGTGWASVGTTACVTASSGIGSTSGIASGGCTSAISGRASTGVTCSGCGTFGVAIWGLSAISIGAGTLAAFERISPMFSASTTARARASPSSRPASRASRRNRMILSMMIPQQTTEAAIGRVMTPFTIASACRNRPSML